ncbi:MAG: hypothetical protein JXA57_17815 [Armatimonadetes bacterium]|nr:hypothetical protein [Armatimonadota bacterium]
MATCIGCGAVVESCPLCGDDLDDQPGVYEELDSVRAALKQVKAERDVEFERAERVSARGDEHGHGNVVVAREPDGEYRAHVYRDWEAAIEAHPCLSLYRAHHVTCPQAKDWRKETPGGMGKT